MFISYKLSRRDIYITVVIFLVVLVLTRNVVFTGNFISIKGLLTMLLSTLILSFLTISLINMEHKRIQMQDKTLEVDKNKTNGSLKEYLNSMSVWDYIAYAFIIIALIYTIRNLYGFSNISFWRHDAVYYINSYIDKLQTEGRWINFIFFKLLKFIPAILSITIHYMSLGFFTFKAAENITNDKKISLLIALIAVNMTPIVAQLMWPVTTLPAFLFLGITPLIYNRMTKWTFFTLSAIVFFATFSNYYFIIPILFLGEILEKAEDGQLKNSFIYTFKEIVLPWLVCFLIGYLVANLITSGITGSFIELADWRQPHKVDSFSQLIANIREIFEFIIRDLLIIKDSLGFVIIIPVIALTIMSFNARRYTYVLICVLVAASVYGSTILDGIYISHRTVVPIVMGLIFLFLIPKYKFSKGYITNFILTFCVAIAFTSSSYERIAWFRNVSNFYYEELEKGDWDIDPSKYNGVIILIDDSEIDYFTKQVEAETGLKQPEGIEGLPTVPRTIVPALCEMGFSDFSINPVDYEFKKTYEKDILIIKEVDENNNLVIYFNYEIL